LGRRRKVGTPTSRPISEEPGRSIYATGVLSVTFSAVTTGAVTASNYVEDATTHGILDFTIAGSPRTAGSRRSFAQYGGGANQGTVPFMNGLIQQSQNLKVSLSFDGGDWVEVFRILGTGKYVNKAKSIAVGSYTIGDKTLGGGVTVFANPYEVEFTVASSRYEYVRVRFDASVKSSDTDPHRAAGRRLCVGELTTSLRTSAMKASVSCRFTLPPSEPLHKGFETAQSHKIQTMNNLRAAEAIIKAGRSLHACRFLPSDAPAVGTDGTMPC